MATKDNVKRKLRKKLTLSRKTIRDLTLTKEKADAARGGVPPARCTYRPTGC